MKKIISVVFALLIIVAGIQIATAMPYFVTFIGNATIDNVSIPPGTNISAYLDENLCGSTLSPENPQNPGDYWNFTSNLECTGDASQAHHDVKFTVGGHLADEIGPDDGSLNKTAGVDGVDGWRRVNLAVTTTAPVCSDLNNDGIVTNDWNDLMSNYKCFLDINGGCGKIFYQNWAYMKKEYTCFIGNN